VIQTRDARVSGSVKGCLAGMQNEMQLEGEASVPGRGFTHQALIYDSDREFMDVVLPFLEAGLSSKQPTLVTVQDRHCQKLRSAFGDRAEGLTLCPAEEWYETSARTRDKFARWVAEHAWIGGRARLIAEPPWAVGHEAQVRDWARHESVINLAFAGQPLTLICPYDASALPEEILRHARGTHPEIVDRDGVSASPSYEDPNDFCQRMDSAVEAQRGTPALEVSFGLGDLPKVRRTVRSFAQEAGLADRRANEVVLAVNEIATNAVVHGRPPATLRAWHAGEEIVVEVADAGAGIRDALAGQLTPPPTALGGRGLWLTRLLCDAVEVRSPKGSAVTVRAATTNGDRSLTAA
jgi:anti-sigma regulatory factor (Ser/Thr protein kinase)